VFTNQLRSGGKNRRELDLNHYSESAAGSPQSGSRAVQNPMPRALTPSWPLQRLEVDGSLRRKATGVKRLFMRQFCDRNLLRRAIDAPETPWL
jgi:hypothetical protein